MLKRKQAISILVLLILGVVVGGLILTQDGAVNSSSGHGPAPIEGPATNAGAEQGPTKGPNEGKLFTSDGFGVEVTIFEQGVPPQFRLYLYENGRPLSPAAARVSLTLSRLGAAPQVFNLSPEGGYLLGDQVVEEPHSFDVAIAAERGGKNFRWSYSQVEARVEMPDAVLKSTGVEILTAGPATIKTALKLQGEIKFNEERMVLVVPRLPGTVIAVRGALGQPVKKGDVLAVIESQGLAELRSQFMAARKRLLLARTTAAREKKLWEEKISAEQDHLAALQVLNEAEITYDVASEKLRGLGVRPDEQSQGRSLSRFEVRAPISGVIVNAAVAMGQTLKEDAGIFTLADLSTVWVEITVYPKDLGVIEIGQRAAIKAAAFEAEGLGMVSHIGALVGEQTRTAKARVTLDNTKGQWRPGMFVDAELKAEEARVPVAVAVEAVQTVRDWQVVFGRYGDYFEARPLELGRSDGNMVEVLKGLSAGEKYAGGNSFAIKADLGKSGATHDH